MTTGDDRSTAASAFDAWLAAPPTLGQVSTTAPESDARRWLSLQPGDVVYFGVAEATRIERDALLALDAALALPDDDGDDEPVDDDDEPVDDLEGVVTRIDERIWSRGAIANDEASPGRPVLVIDGLDALVDPSPRLWTTLVRRATRALGVHVLASRSALLFGDAPLPRFAIDPRIVSQVEGVASGAIAIDAIDAEIVRLGGVHVERAAASTRALVSPAWFAAWRREADWPVGFCADVRRFRKIAEDDALDLVRPGAFVDLIEAAIVEGVARAHAAHPRSLEPDALARDRASALASIALLVGGEPRSTLVASIDAELSTCTPAEDVARERDALLLPRVDADAYRARPARLDEIQASTRDDDPVRTWLASLDDVASVEQRAHLARFASPPVAKRLASEAARAQILGGDDDSLIQLGFVASHLSQADASAVIVARLGHHEISRLLGQTLDLVAPFLARVCDTETLVAIAEVVRRRAIRLAV